MNQAIISSALAFGLIASSQTSNVFASQCPQKLTTIIKDQPFKPDGQSPEIIDPTHNMARFFRKLRDLADGKTQKVRIGVYGDSNYTMDWGTSALRENLGSLFGHGGHGFVAGGQPWSWYQHREIAIKTSGGWRSYATSTPRHASNDYGHSGILGFGAAGAAVTYESQDRGSAEDRVFDQIVVHYSCRPQKGAFTVTIDGQATKTIETYCPQTTYRVEAFKVPLSKHKVELKVAKGTVYLFGASFEREQPGIVVDGLGVGALNLYRTATLKEELFAAGLKQRAYDLVVFHTGTNMWNPKKHSSWAKTVIARLRAALGDDISIMLVSPPDFRDKKTKKSHPRMAACGQEKKAIAAAEGIAFWDYYAAMGGAGSISKWRDQGMVAPDYVHLKEGLHKIMMTKMTAALLAHGNQLWEDKKGDCLGYQAAADQKPQATEVN